MKNFSKIKLLLITITVTVFLYFSAWTANAIMMSPAVFEYDVSPGDTINGTVELTNNENTPKYLTLGLNDTYILARNQTTQYTDEAQPRGIINWTTILDEPFLADPGESHIFNYRINIPEDAEPGTYSGALMATGKEGLDKEGSFVGVAPRVAGRMSITVAGDFEESLTEATFNIDLDRYQKGNVVFEFKAKNDGNVKISPVGQISIYDDKGEKISEVFAVLKNIDNQNVVIDRVDEIPFNQGNETILPGETKKISTSWTNRNIPKGTYTAKLDLFYGQDNTKIELETEPFEIKENFQISEFTTDATFQNSLPIDFTAKLVNQGSVNLEPSGYFSIKNIFGIEKKRVDLSPAELKINGGEEKLINNLTWESGFAFGYYTANLNLQVGDNSYSNSISFWILSWWQIVITIVVLVLLVFILYKIIHSYSEMKKKLKEKETTKEEK